MATSAANAFYSSQLSPTSPLRSLCATVFVVLNLFWQVINSYLSFVSLERMHVEVLITKTNSDQILILRVCGKVTT